MQLISLDLYILRQFSFAPCYKTGKVERNSEKNAVNIKIEKLFNVYPESQVTVSFGGK